MRIIALFNFLIAPVSITAFISKPSQQLPKGWKLQATATLDDRVIEGELKPTNNFVLVKIAKEAEEVAGGILLTKSVSFMYVYEMVSDDK